MSLNSLYRGKPSERKFSIPIDQDAELTKDRIAEEYNLEQRYRKNFTEVWDADKDDPVLGPLSIRMGVRRDAGSPMNLSDEEREVISKCIRESSNDVPS